MTKQERALEVAEKIAEALDRTLPAWSRVGSPAFARSISRWSATSHCFPRAARERLSGPARVELVAVNWRWTCQGAPAGYESSSCTRHPRIGQPARLFCPARRRRGRAAGGTGAEAPQAEGVASDRPHESSTAGRRRGRSSPDGSSKARGAADPCAHGNRTTP